MSLSDKLENISNNNLIIAENQEKVYKAGQSSMVDESKIIEKTVSGEYISVDDVSEIPHEVKVTLTSGDSTNLLNVDALVNGNLVKNSDGSYTITKKTEADRISATVPIHIPPQTKVFCKLETVEDTSAYGLNFAFYCADGTTLFRGKTQYSEFTHTKEIVSVYVYMRGSEEADGVYCTFKNLQINTETLKPYEPYKETLTDYSGVSLTRCGGNLFDCLNSQPPTNTYGYAIITDRTENSITIQKSHSNGYEYAEFVLPNIQAGEKITVYAEWTCSGNNNGMIRVNWNSKLEPGDIITSSQKSGVSASGIIPEKPSNATHLSLLLYGGTSGETSAGLEVYYKNIMVNIGDKTIKFEPYNAQTLTANADGTVEGVKITSPYMYMTTDNPNVTINATYHKSYGMQTEYDRFWDTFQDYGKRTDYQAAFRFQWWTDAIFKPKYLIQPTNAENMFQRTAITDIRMVDLTKATSVGSLCNSSTQGIRYVGQVGNSSLTTFGSVFGWCHKLISVEKMIVGAGAQFANAFTGCYDLVSIAFEGTIAYDISFANSPKLNRASIISIFNALSGTVTGKTLTLSKTAVTNAFGSIDYFEWNDIVASKSNWTISLV